MPTLNQTLKALYQDTLSDGEVELATSNHIAKVEIIHIARLEVHQTPWISFCIGILILAVAIKFLRKK